MRYRYGQAIRLFLFVMVFASTTLLLWSWQWPHEESRVFSGFGQSANGGYLVGVKLVAPEQEFRPVEDGEVVFRSRPSRLPQPIPSTLGGVLALEHGRSFRSLYGHIDPDSLDSGAQRLEREDVVGRFGPNGFNSGSSLHVEIFDLEQDVRVNPLLLLPRMEKNTRPVVQAAYLRPVDSQEPGSREPVLVQGGAISVAPGNWLIELESSDALGVAGAPRIAPHSYTVRVDGEESYRIAYDTADVRDGQLQLSGRRAHQEFYDETGAVKLSTFELRDTPVNLVIEVRDHVGNLTERSIRVIPEAAE